MRRADRGRSWLTRVARAGALTLALASALAVSVGAGSAQAASQREHAFGFSFKGEGECELQEPVAVAVNESSHDLYVLDAGLERVVRFGPDGECIERFKAKIEEPQSIAIDNSGGESAGDVYVAGAEGTVIDKFSASGESIEKLKKYKLPGETSQELEEIHGLAVDASGELFVYEDGTYILHFDAAAANKAMSRLELQGCEARPGFAVAPAAEDFYVGRLLENAEDECLEEPEPDVIAKLGGSGNVLITGLARENSTGVAVDLASQASTPLGASARGDAYVDTGTAITAVDSGGALIQRFGGEGEPQPLKDAHGLAIAAFSGDVYVADAGGHQIDVFKPAESGPPVIDSVSARDLSTTLTELEAEIDPDGVDTHYYFQFGTADCETAPEACTDLPASPPGADIGSQFGDVHVGVPASGLQPGTVYHYRLIASSSAGSVASALGTFSTLPSAAGVLPDERAWELVSPADKHGASIQPMTFSGGLAQASEGGDAISYVSNAPVTSEPEGFSGPQDAQVLSTRSAAGWSSQDIVAPQDEIDGFPQSQLAEYLYFSPDLSLSLLFPYTATAQNKPPLSPPLLEGESQEATPYLRADAPLAPPPGSGEEALYDQAAANRGYLAPGYLALVTAANDTASPSTHFAGALTFVDATPQLDHVVLESAVALTAAPEAPEGGLYEWSAGAQQSEQLRMVSVLPDGLASPTAELAGHGGGFSAEVGPHAISDDGSRVFWEDTEAEGLYMREFTQAGARTVKVDAAQGPPEPEGESEAMLFQGASSDGSRVFFTDTHPLTSDSRLAPPPGVGLQAPADLYEYDVKSGKLSDLTVDRTPGQSAEVLGDLLGMSDDGANVYFVANGQLAPGAVAGGCVAAAIEAREPDARCNLYVEHYDAASETWQPPKLVALLSEEDSNDWGGRVESFAHLTARVSRNGEYLAFMSDEPLTGSPTEDANPEAGGARAEEVYLYDGAREQLICASCDPEGARPKGIFDGASLGLLVDRLGLWQNRWLAGSIPGWTPLNEETGGELSLYQSRYLTDEGRLFFDSPEPLAGHGLAENGQENVYEYEPDGIGSCAQAAGCVALISSGTGESESAFLDASAHGDNVFFLTSQPLVAAVHENSVSVYDARVCTSSSPCLRSESASPQACESEPSPDACRPASSQQPAAGSPPASTALVGTSAVRPPPPPKRKAKPLTRAQQLARALTACRKHYRPGKRRGRCERSARRKYATKPKHRAKPSARRKSTAQAHGR